MVAHLIPWQDRFWSNVAPLNVSPFLPQSCHQWQGSVSPRGYGVFHDCPSRHEAVHKIAYELHFGVSIPPGVLIEQTCGNRLCVRKEHLRRTTNTNYAFHHPPAIWGGTNRHKSDHDRFWEKTKPDADGCPIWTAHTLPNGYGVFSPSPSSLIKASTVQRIAWQFFYGPIPDTANVVTSCGKKLCVRLKHLLLVGKGFHLAFPIHSPIPTAQEFLTHIDQTDSCWILRSATFRPNSPSPLFRNRNAHRLSLLLFTQIQTASSAKIIASCGNPFCVKPAHLFPAHKSPLPPTQQTPSPLPPPTPKPSSQPPLSAAERFQRFVGSSVLGCSPWNGHRDPCGYGTFSITVNGKQKKVRAHRFAYELAHGPIPPGLWVLHRCHNPACVNIDHLHLGNIQENISDMMQANRQNNGSKTKLSETDVLGILRDRAAGLTYAQLSQKYGLHENPLRRIVKGQAWKHLPRGAQTPPAEKIS